MVERFLFHLNINNINITNNHLGAFMDNQEKNSISIIWGILDNPWHTLWVIKFFYVTLFLDSIMSLLFKKGIFHYTAINLSEFSLGHATIIILSLGFFSAYLLPFLNTKLRHFFISIEERFFPKKCSLITDSYNAQGTVSLSELFNNKTINLFSDHPSYLNKLYEEKSKEILQKRKNKYQIESLLLGVIILLIIDNFLFHDESISNFLKEFLSDGVFYILYTLLLLALISLYYQIIMNIDFSEKFYNPVLYNQINRK